MTNIAVIAGSFHQSKVEKMMAQAKESAAAAELSIALEIWVPGALEVPLALQHVLGQGHIAAAVLLGIIEKGQTKHGFVMAQAVFPKIIDLQLESRKPVGVGIIGPEVAEDQIDARLLPHAKAAVEAVHTMLDLLS